MAETEKISTGPFKMERIDEDMFHKESGQRSEKKKQKKQVYKRNVEVIKEITDLFQFSLTLVKPWKHFLTI